MSNKIEKQRTALRAIGIVALALGFLGAVGGIIMTVFGIIGLVNSNNLVGDILLLVFGVLLLIGGVLAVVWAFTATWVGFSIKATQGSIAEGDLSKGTVNGKKCPKCGCTNTPDATECTSCHTPL